jgi:hypothetical protein
MKLSFALMAAASLALLAPLGACGSSNDDNAADAGNGGGSKDGGANGSGDASCASLACANDGGTSTGDAGPDADSGPVTPTVSSWMGINADADLPWSDVATQLAAFTLSNGGKADANGYPVAGASGTSSTDMGFLLPSGTYAISFTGTGTLTVGGIGKLAGTWTTSGGVQSNTVTITGTPGTFGQSLTLGITNAAGQSVTGIHLYLPGVAPASAGTFSPQYLAMLKPFRAVRFMDWAGTNGSTITDWSARTLPTTFGVNAGVVPWETMIELLNETGKDGWINVPEHATDAYVKSLGDLFAANLDLTRVNAARAAAGLTTPFTLYVEYANETWNTGFTAYNTLLAAAKAAPTTYTGMYTGSYGPTFMSQDADLMKVGQVEGDRLVQIGMSLRKELASTAVTVAPVLAGWALGPAYSDDALTFIKAKYGDPKQYVSAVAIAPYFSVDDSNGQTDSLGNLFTALDTAIDGTDATLQQFAMLVKQYGLQMTAYEGGQGFTGSTNLMVKHLAQYDARMNASYTRALSLWQKDLGNALYMHFVLASTPGIPESFFQYGFWGAAGSVLLDPATCGNELPTLTGSETIASVSTGCPKYAALAAHVPQ